MTDEKRPLAVSLFGFVYRTFSRQDIKDFEEQAIEAFADRLEVAGARGSFARRKLVLQELLNVLTTRAGHGSTRSPRRSRQGAQMLETFRYSVRTLLRNPGFAAVAVVTLGLGIGLSTAIFSVVNGVLLSPLPYPDEDRVVVVSNSWEDGRLDLSEKETVRYRALDNVFEYLGVYSFGTRNLRGADRTERLVAANIDVNVLPALGVPPVLGRNFRADEDTRGGPFAAILSHSYWMTRFAGDPSIVGTSVILDGSSFDVVGVMPEGFRLPLDYVGTPVSIYVPLRLNSLADPRNLHYLNSVARLAPGVTVARGTAGVATTAFGLIEEFGTLPETFSALVIPVREEIVGAIRPALLILLTAVGLVLLIACVNVANLMLARTDQRRQELAIRRALGAGRSALLSVVLGEVGLLAALGGLTGLFLAYGGTQALAALSPAGLPRSEGITMNGTVVLFAVGTTVLSALMFGLMPALKAVGRAGRGGLAEGTRGTSGVATQKGRRFLLVAEITLAMALTIGAGLTVKSFFALTSVDPGFDREGVLTMRIELTSDYRDPTAARDFYARLLENVRGFGSVVEAGAIRALPLAARVGDWGIRIRGTGPDGMGERGPKADWQVATDGLFEAMGIPLVEGRYFETSDRVGTLNAVIINETMASTYWGEGSALGAQFRMTTDIDTIWRTVVGIVGDVKQEGLDQVVPTTMYLPHSQFPSTANFAVRSMTLAVRTLGDPTNLARTLTEEIRRMDPEVPVSSIRNMEEVVVRASAEQRFQGLLIGTFAIAALMLVSVGIYGVTSYLIGQRIRELGIRVALGASPAQVLKLVVAEGATLAVIGVTLGLVAAAALSRTLASLLFGVTAMDFQVYGGVTGLVTATVLLATYVPARKATKIDAAEVLRGD